MGVGMPATSRRAKLNTNKWIKRLRREATANPKKAAVLGLLLMVAAYYWYPLVAGWLAADGPGKKGAIAVAMPQQPPVLGNAATAAAPADNPVAQPTWPWQVLRQWRTADERTVATTDLGLRRDPFQVAQARRMELAEKKQTPVAQPEPVITAASLGLQLSSTMVGPGRSLAIINGRTYQLGQILEWSKDGTSLALELAEVAPGRIVLRSEGQSLEVTIPQRPIAGRLELVRSRD